MALVHLHIFLVLGLCSFLSMSEQVLYGHFSSVAGPDQRISARELQGSLTSSGVTGSIQTFSLETCRLMIAMLDRDFSGEMEFQEFKDMWDYINQMRQTFMIHDGDRSGTFEPHELQKYFSSLGYNLSPSAYARITRRYSEKGRITFDDFISCIIKLQMLTAYFRQRDLAQKGQATFHYDEFMQITMGL